MRSLFWRVFAAFLLAIICVAVLSALLGRAFNGDRWIINHYPPMHNLAQEWTDVYEHKGERAAQRYLEIKRHRDHINVQVLDENDRYVVPGTFNRRAAAREAQHEGKDLPWRRVSEEYTSPLTGNAYLFIYRIPHNELFAWQRQAWLWPVSVTLLGLTILVIFSFLLTLSITKPLNSLRNAVHDLGLSAYQQHRLDKLAQRHDELGVLARDFNKMGSRVQELLDSQRQLLRDVSHELRSPLARLKIALALAERADDKQLETLWPRLEHECDRLEDLISEILVLARIDAEHGLPQPLDWLAMLNESQENAQLTHPEQTVELDISLPANEMYGWPVLIQRALENLVNNALRFNPEGEPLVIRLQPEHDGVSLTVLDRGPGVSEAELAQLGTPFFRAPQQQTPGYGLGLAITRRSVERHGGQLLLGNRPDGGFYAEMRLPRTLQPVD